MKKEQDTKQHCTGCTEADKWDLPEGRTHQMDTIEHPLLQDSWEIEFEKDFDKKFCRNDLSDTKMSYPPHWFLRDDISRGDIKDWIIERINSVVSTTLNSTLQRIEYEAEKVIEFYKGTPFISHDNLVKIIRQVINKEMI
jgi:hypothetical protein